MPRQVKPRRDDRTYIRVHDGMPDHPKVEPLSDAAFRLLVTTWCWCSRNLTDGHVPDGVWRKRGTAKTRAELERAGLAEPVPDGVQMHDYTDHQSTAAEVREFKASKRANGEEGNHQRWHVARNQPDPGCHRCIAERLAETSQQGSRPGSRNPSQDDRGTLRETSPTTTTEGSTSRGESPDPATRAARPPRRCANHINNPNPPACPACADTRRTADAWSPASPADRPAAELLAAMPELDPNLAAAGSAAARAALATRDTA